MAKTNKNKSNSSATKEAFRNQIAHQVEVQKAINKQSPMPMIYMSIVSIAYHLLILGYIITLENEKCNCVMDWRHKFIKYYTGGMLIYSVIIILLAGTDTLNSLLYSSLQTILIIMSCINAYCLFTYIGELDSTNCACAVENQNRMHSFLKVWRYILIAASALGLIGVLFTATK